MESPARRPARRRLVVAACCALVVAGGTAAGVFLAGRHAATGQLALVGTQRAGAGAVVSSVVLSGWGISSTVTTSGAPLMRAPGQSDLGIVRVPTGTYTRVDASIGGRQLSFVGEPCGGRQRDHPTSAIRRDAE